MPTVLLSLRLPFLILTPICVLLGSSVYEGAWADFPGFKLAVALLAALLAHIAVNTMNEWQDFASGLDLHTKRTPFSGGSGGLPTNPAALGAVKAVAILSLLLCILSGLWLVWHTGWVLLPLGLLGLALVVAYTRWINRSPWICLLAPGLGFGVLMVNGTAWVVSSGFNPDSLLLSLLPFFLVNNLLLLNQYPDIDADRAHGRLHLPIARGVDFSNRVYQGFAIASLMVLSLVAFSQQWPIWAYGFWLAALPLGVVFQGMQQCGDKIGAQPQYLAINVMITLVLPTIAAVLNFWF